MGTIAQIPNTVITILSAKVWLIFMLKMIFKTVNDLDIVIFSLQKSFSSIYSVADPGFSPGGAPTPKIAIIFHIFAENCMKMKEFGSPGGARIPGAPPWIRQ